MAALVALTLGLPSGASGQLANSGGEFDVPGSLRGLLGQTGGGIGGNEIRVSAQFFTDRAGRQGVIEVTAELAEDWHIYSISQPPGGPVRTEIIIQDTPAVTTWGEFKPLTAPEIKKYEYMEVSAEEHGGTVTWRAPFQLAPETDARTLTIEGELDGQICKEACIQLSSMDTTFAARFAGIAEELFAAPAAPLIKGQDIQPNLAGPGSASTASLSNLARNIFFGLVGGLLLNLMPCVLPVIGLKVLSFVQQSGDNRLRVWQLNLCYAIGIISVFLLLGTMAAFLNMGWGEQFTLPWFRVAMALLVFAMALSFLGVWEIPIPGFVGSGKSGELAEQEGLHGAFFKGVFTTILATPCSGPFLGPVFAYTLKQPPYVTYAIFASVGLGMSTPYLAVGMFPSLMRFLPKPGAWMETFKQLMGFLLLATVVYLFQTVGSRYFIATFASLVGVWFSCWWIGRTPLTANFDRKFSAWIAGALVTAAVMVGSFQYLVEHEGLIDWLEFSPARVAQGQADGQTVMVDFTADWCPNCKFNLKMAIDTEKVSQLVEEYGVLPLLADWTDPSDEIKTALEQLDSRSIPVLAIYPANAPGEVIILRDLLTESKVIGALQEAGPSHNAQQTARTETPQRRGYD